LHPLSRRIRAGIGFLFSLTGGIYYTYFKRKTEPLIGGSEEADLKVNTESTKYMLMSQHQNAGQNHNIKIANRVFENVANFKYFKTMLTNRTALRDD
jgi:hypothetical protein